MGAEIVLGEGDGERGVCGEIECFVAFTRVSGGRELIALGVDWREDHFMTAMFTGAVVLAR